MSYSTPHQPHDMNLAASALQCVACDEQLTRAVHLPCLHLVCPACVDSGKDICCSTCGITVSAEKKHELPDAVFLASTQFAECQRPECDTCGGSVHVAVCYCPQCAQWMCAAGRSRHSRTRSRYTHHVQMLGDVTHSSEVGADAYADSICRLHSRLHRYYCKQCRVALCAKCRMDTHEGHETTPLHAFEAARNDVMHHLQLLRQFLNVLDLSAEESPSHESEQQQHALDEQQQHALDEQNQQDCLDEQEKQELDEQGQQELDKQAQQLVDDQQQWLDEQEEQSPDEQEQQWLDEQLQQWMEGKLQQWMDEQLQQWLGEQLQQCPGEQEQQEMDEREQTWLDEQEQQELDKQKQQWLDEQEKKCPDEQEQQWMDEQEQCELDEQEQKWQWLDEQEQYELDEREQLWLWLDDQSQDQDSTYTCM